MTSMSDEVMANIRLKTFEDMAHPEKGTAWLAPVWASLLPGWFNEGLRVVREETPALECAPDNAYHGQQLRYLGDGGAHPVLCLTLDWRISLGLGQTKAVTFGRAEAVLELWAGRLAGGKEVEREELQLARCLQNLNPPWSDAWPQLVQAMVADFEKRQAGSHAIAKSHEQGMAFLVASSLDWITP